MFKYCMPRLSSRYTTLLVCFVLVSVAAITAQGPRTVPVPVPPSANRAPAIRKDRSGFPAVPVFKDIAKQVGLTQSHTAAPEAHYVIDSTSGGTGLFDCDNDGRLDAVLVNGSMVERSRL